MATLSRVINLYINGDKPGGLNAVLDGKDSVPPGEKTRWMQGDKCPINLWFRKPGEPGAHSTVYELPAGSTIVLAAKAENAQADDDDVLFSVSSFAKTGSGDDIYYAGTLDLNTTELDTAMTALTSGNTVDVAVDIEVRDALNTERLSFRADVEVARQVYSDEGAPTAGAPLYALMAFGTVAIGNGDSIVAVTGLALDAVPLQIFVSVHKPNSGGDNLFATILYDSLTVDGFTAHLSAPAPAAGYKLQYLLLQGVA